MIRHHWDDRAPTFDDEPGHGLVNEEQRRAWLVLLSRITGQPPRRVLDVGCGTGFMALRFAELGHDATGIDLSPQMVEQARRNAQQRRQSVDFRVGNALDLEFGDETYDLVVARHVIWTLPDPRRAVAEWLRVLRPGARLVLIEGKWADNEALALSYARPASQMVARVVAAATPLALRHSHGYARRVLTGQYRRVAATLPFSGGPTASRLANFLQANLVHDVVVEPLMDPVLWGEPPPFPRYLVTGVRAPDP